MRTQDAVTTASSSSHTGLLVAALAGLAVVVVLAFAVVPRWLHPKQQLLSSWRVLEPWMWWRATTSQLCGFWPFGVGSGVPRWGAPIGVHQRTGATIACDPISYFLTGLISNPSMFLMGKPGLGKSTLVARMILALNFMGIHTMVLGDLKPDYVDVVRAIGGQIIRLGRGRGHLNILDHDYAVRWATAKELVSVTSEDGESWWPEYHFVLPEKDRLEILSDVHGRRKNGVLSLLNITRHRPPTERETNILDRALVLLFANWVGPAVPVLRDLLQVIESAPKELRAVALDHGSMKRYREQTDALVASLRSLSDGGGLGDIFSQRTDVEMMMDRSVCFDVSSIDHTDDEIQAAALLAIWNLGFGKVELQQQLADLGLVKRQNYLVVMDELWRALRMGKGMVDRMDASTRLNRTQGIGLMFVTHTLKDLDSVADKADRKKALGIPERCGIVGLFGLPRSEMRALRKVVRVSRAEENDIVSWSEPPSWDQETGAEAEPPGLGLAYIKVSGRGGLPVHIRLTDEEKNLHNTNQRWERLAKTDHGHHKVAA